MLVGYYLIPPAPFLINTMWRGMLVDDAQLHGNGNGLRAAGNVEFAQDVTDVEIYSSFADALNDSNLWRGFPGLDPG